MRQVSGHLPRKAAFQPARARASGAIDRTAWSKESNSVRADVAPAAGTRRALPPISSEQSDLRLPSASWAQAAARVTAAGTARTARTSRLTVTAAQPSRTRQLHPGRLRGRQISQRARLPHTTSASTRADRRFGHDRGMADCLCRSGSARQRHGLSDWESDATEPGAAEPQPGGAVHRSRRPGLTPRSAALACDPVPQAAAWSGAVRTGSGNFSAYSPSAAHPLGTQAPRTPLTCVNVRRPSTTVLSCGISRNRGCVTLLHACDLGLRAVAGVGFEPT